MKEDGLTHPALLRKPTLRGDCFDYYETYRFLSVPRIYNQVGPLPILRSDLVSTLDELHIWSVDERMKFIRFMKMMDATELDIIAKRQAAKK